MARFGPEPPPSSSGGSTWCRRPSRFSNGRGFAEDALESRGLQVGQTAVPERNSNEYSICCLTLAIRLRLLEMLYSATRLGVLVLGDRLVVAALGRKAVDTFEVQSDNPAAALRAELDARGISARTAAIGLSRA